MTPSLLSSLLVLAAGCAVVRGSALLPGVAPAVVVVVDVALPRPAERVAAAAPPLFSIQTVGMGASVVRVPAAAATADFDGTAAKEAPPPPPDHDYPPPPPPNEDYPPPYPSLAPGECRLMGPFAIFVQLGLGALALLSLVYKRWRERPQRPVRIWFFDVSKQVFGSVLVHMANVFMSLLTSGRFNVSLGGAAAARDEPYVPNPCSFYLLNLGIDTTLGIPILILLLRLLTALVAYTPLGQPPASVQSGNYGQPPRAGWWLKQSMLYFGSLLGMKLCVLVIFLALPWIAHVGDWALRWTEGNEQLQIVFVMMLFPLIMNAMQYYIIDSFIKEPTGAAAADEEDHRRRSRVLYDHLSDDNASSEDEGLRDAADDDSAAADADNEDSDHEDDLASIDAHSSQDDVVKSKRAVASSVRSVVVHVAETEYYDPDRDGDSRTVIGSSASQQSRPPTGKEA